jgi:hypothetical protein
VLGDFLLLHHLTQTRAISIQKRSAVVPLRRMPGPW